MSSLDESLDDMAAQVADQYGGSWFDDNENEPRERAEIRDPIKKRIKDLILGLTPLVRGNDGTFGGGTMQTGVEQFDAGYNSAIAEFRKRISKL